MAPRRRRSGSRGPGKYDRALSASERRAEQRGRLLWASAEVFAAKGFARASVDAIVKRAKMSRRTFYDHFEDLADALVAVYDFAVSTLFQHVEAKVRAETDPIEKLRAGIESYLTLYSQHAELSRVLHREIRAAGPKHAVRHEATVARFGALISEGVAEAYAQGIATRAPDETTIYALVSGIEAVGMRYLDRGEEHRIGEAVPLLTELAVRAFR